MRKYLQIILPIAFLLFSVFVLFLLFLTRPKASVHPVVETVPMVSVVVAQARDISIPVFTRGHVVPFQEQTLQSSSDGFVTYVAPSLVRGGHVRKGELLLLLNDVQLESRIRHANVEQLMAEQNLLQTTLESQHLGTYPAAKTLVDAAKQSAQLQEAASRRLVLELQNQKQRARITAPFDGWVSEEIVADGMYVHSGMGLARLFAEDCVDVQVELSDEQLQLLELPVAFSDSPFPVSTAEVSLQQNGERFYWHGVVAGSEGQVDQISRQVVVQVRIFHPDRVRRNATATLAPELLLGMLAEVEISGRLVPDLYQLPLEAIHNGTQVWVVDKVNRLRPRAVDILYKGRESIYVTRGVRDGDRVMVTQLHNAAEGLQVRVHDTNPISFPQARGNTLL